MRGDATLFTRNDEVEAQWRICDPIVKAWAQRPTADARAAAASTQPARRGRRRPTALLLRGRPLARDLMAAPSAATPSGASRARRPTRSKRRCASCSSSATPKTDSFVPARVLNMIAFVDREWSGEIANRLRGRRALPRLAPARALLRAAPRAPGRARDDRLRRRAGAGRAGAAARDRRRGDRRPPPRRPAHDRRPAGRHRPADAAVVAARPPRGRRRAAGARAGGAAGLGRRAGRASEALDRACELSEQAYVVDLAWLRSTPWRERIAATFDPPRLRPELRLDRRRDGAPPSRLDRRRDAPRRLARLAPGLAGGSRWRTDGGALVGARQRRRPGRRRCAWRRPPSCRCPASRASPSRPPRACACA